MKNDGEGIRREALLKLQLGRSGKGSASERAVGY